MKNHNQILERINLWRKLKHFLDLLSIYRRRWKLCLKESSTRNLFCHLILNLDFGSKYEIKTLEFFIEKTVATAYVLYYFKIENNIAQVEKTLFLDQIYQVLARQPRNLGKQPKSLSFAANPNLSTWLNIVHDLCHGQSILLILQDFF